MSRERPSERPIPTCSRTSTREEYHGLSTESYVCQRLQHATPEHLHVTSRRFFVGPLPKGWLIGHRKSWYRSWLGLKDYSSKMATFSEDVSLAHQRQLTGMIGPSPAALYKPSFPQPRDVDEDEPVEESSPPNGRRVETTMITPVDTAHERPHEPPRNEESPAIDETSSSSTPTPRATDSVSAGPLPGGPSDPTLRVSSTDQVPEPFFTAPESPKSASGAAVSSLQDMGPSSQEALTPMDEDNQPTPRGSPRGRPPREGGSAPSVSTTNGEPLTANTSSAASLLPHGKNLSGTRPSPYSSRQLQQEDPSVIGQDTAVRAKQEGNNRRFMKHMPSGMVRFNVGDNVRDRQRRLNKRLSRTHTREERSAKQSAKDQRKETRCGEIVRAERMLVRIEATNEAVPDDYTENRSIKIDTQTVSKWREFLVVCRRGCEEQTPFLIQLYKTRVIPRVQKSDTKKKCSYEIPIQKSSTKVNLFSSLDKTVVIWLPSKARTKMFIMKARSSTHSVEWYTFLREALGWKRPTTLLVNVPDLEVSIHFRNPFAHFGETRNEADNLCSAVLKTMTEEQAVASGIIRTCLTTLGECTQWASILDFWAKTEKMGLAWRRYDRLEWVHGANEQRMYGTMAMRTSHELELRPKQHYPTITHATGGEKTEEPPPIEGFLILLTSQRGKHRHFAQNFSKRLYFYSQSQYLCFCKPAKAQPPAPPSLPTVRGNRVPTTSEIIRESPIVYTVNPFPVVNGEVAWLSTEGSGSAQRSDAEAYAEDRRNARNVSQAEGYINFCRIAEVRAVAQDSTEDQNVNSGDVEYHGHARGVCRTTDPRAQQSKCCRTFEILLDDGLTIRFRAYDKQTREEWVKRLTELVTYWKSRTRADVMTLKDIRQQNLKRLEIDEAQESLLGQFAQKWEVSRAQASPELFHTCGMSGCRSIKMSGQLYRKPRRHGAFAHCSVLLIEGQLLIFQGSLRKFSGQQVPHTYHSRKTTLDLRDCYIYSGIITSSDLLYQNQNFDSNLPGRHPSPRMYTSDGWTSADEDTATCFVIWHTSRKELFRAQEEHGGRARWKWRQVSALGVPGKSTVFKTRSRAERDMWVLAIGTEIDRLQQMEDLRFDSSES